MSEDTAIIGAGFCGTVLAANLLRHPSRSGRIVLVERSGRVGRGIAYAEREVPFLLNVPAGRLSADSRDPQQFLNFAREHLPEAGPEDFLPRSLYGLYLEQFLRRAEREAGDATRLECIADEVLDIRPGHDGFTLSFKQRDALDVQRVVLAVGVPMSLGPAWTVPLQEHGAYHRDPWSLPKNLTSEHTVMILGNGLTMADVAMALSWRREDLPLMHTLSRHGVLPQTQTEFDPGIAPGAEMMLTCAGSARQLLRITRSHAADLEATGGDWRQVVTLVRQLAPRIWRQLSLVERRRFLRHMQVHWSTHRHRMPPQVAVQLGMLKASGRLVINAGRVQRIAALGQRLRVWWQARGRSGEHSLDVDALINATGPEATLSRTPESLMQSLERQNLIAPDALRLGIRVSTAGECLNAAGRPTPGLYYLGSMLRAELYEATAVTELRNLAEALAQRLQRGAA